MIAHFLVVLVCSESCKNTFQQCGGIYYQGSSCCVPGASCITTQRSERRYVLRRECRPTSSNSSSSLFPMLKKRVVKHTHKVKAKRHESVKKGAGMCDDYNSTACGAADCCIFAADTCRRSHNPKCVITSLLRDAKSIKRTAPPTPAPSVHHTPSSSPSFSSSLLPLSHDATKREKWQHIKQLLESFEIKPSPTPTHSPTQQPSLQPTGSPTSLPMVRVRTVPRERGGWGHTVLMKVGNNSGGVVVIIF